MRTGWRDRVKTVTDLDEQTSHEKLPTTLKLKLLPKIVNAHKRNFHWQCITDNNLLEEAWQWLEPLSGKPLSALDVKKKSFGIPPILGTNTAVPKGPRLECITSSYTRCKQIAPNVMRTTRKPASTWPRPTTKGATSYQKWTMPIADTSDVDSTRAMTLFSCQTTYRVNNDVLIHTTATLKFWASQIPPKHKGAHNGEIGGYEEREWKCQQSRKTIRQRTSPAGVWTKTWTMVISKEFEAGSEIRQGQMVSAARASITSNRMMHEHQNDVLAQTKESEWDHEQEDTNTGNQLTAELLAITKSPEQGSEEHDIPTPRRTDKRKCQGDRKEQHHQTIKRKQTWPRKTNLYFDCPKTRAIWRKDGPFMINNVTSPAPCHLELLGHWEERYDVECGQSSLGAVRRRREHEVEEILDRQCHNQEGGPRFLIHWRKHDQSSLGAVRRRREHEVEETLDLRCHGQGGEPRFLIHWRKYDPVCENWQSVTEANTPAKTEKHHQRKTIQVLKDKKGGCVGRTAVSIPRSSAINPSLTSHIYPMTDGPQQELLTNGAAIVTILPLLSHLPSPYAYPCPIS
jgi:hypothetical protein